MSFISKPLELLEESDFQTLVDNEVPEGKTVDYKEALSGNGDKEKKSFSMTYLLLLILQEVI